jgi:hypothetical protein
MAIWTLLALSSMFTEACTVEAQAAFNRGVDLAASLGDLAHQLRLLSGMQLLLARGGDFQGALRVAKQSVATRQFRAFEVERSCERWARSP